MSPLIEFKSGEYFISIPFDGSYMRMSDRFTSSFVSEKRKNLAFRSLYSIPNFQFVIPEPVLRGKFDIVTKKEKFSMFAERRIYIDTGMPSTEAAIRRNYFNHLYIEDRDLGP